MHRQFQQLNQLDQFQHTPIPIQRFYRLLQYAVNHNLDNNHFILLLMKAIEYNYNDIVRKILEAKESFVHSKITFQQTLLMFAIDSSNDEIAKYLIDKGVDVNAIDENEETSLFKAVSKNNFNIAQLLIEKGADVNYSDSQGNTALNIAAWNNEMAEILKLLLDKGANIESRDEIGRTSLFRSIGRMSFNIADILLDRGANIEAKDIDKNTPLMIAVKKDIEENTILRTLFLLLHGANIYAENNFGYSPLTYVYEKGTENLKSLLDEHIKKLNQINKKKIRQERPKLIINKFIENQIPTFKVPKQDQKYKEFNQENISKQTYDYIINLINQNFQEQKNQILQEQPLSYYQDFLSKIRQKKIQQKKIQQMQKNKNQLYSDFDGISVIEPEDLVVWYYYCKDKKILISLKTLKYYKDNPSRTDIYGNTYEKMNIEQLTHQEKQQRKKYFQQKMK